MKSVLFQAANTLYLVSVNGVPSKKQWERRICTAAGLAVAKSALALLLS